MKKSVVIILFFVCSLFMISASTEKATKKNVTDLAKTFLNNLQAKDTAGIKKILLKDIRLEILSRDKILKLADDMMMGKIPVSEYILNITGHNIQLFLKKKLKFIKIDKFQEYGIERDMSDEKMKGRFHYVKFMISYKDANEKVIKKLIEIDIIKKNDKLMIFGFII